MTRRLFALAPVVLTALLMGPTLAGLGAAAGLALGFFPALSGESAPFAALAAAPGLGRMIGLTLIASLGGACGALLIAVLLTMFWSESRLFGGMRRLLSPFLAAPHAAAAMGFAFLIAPSGWIARLIAPLAGWERPPDLLITQDPWGLSLTAFLAFKEAPFLLLMMISARAQIDEARTLAAARALGEGPAGAWLKAVWPRLWPQMRLPFYATLAYGASAADVMKILGPTTPPPLAAQVLRWAYDADPGATGLAAAGALALALIVAGEIFLVELAARGGGRLLRLSLGASSWPGLAPIFKAAGAMGAGLTAAVLGGGLIALGLWSVAERWRFPGASPQEFSLEIWSRLAPDLARPAMISVALGACAAGLALALAVGCLAHETETGRKPGRALWLIYAPLIVPQASFLFGAQILSLWAGMEPGFPLVLASHLLYVAPYVFLSLSDPWRALNPRLDQAASALGAGPWRRLTAVRAPLLRRAILTAAAVGFAVSLGQYLPTLMLGAGRVPTLALEAVALGSGSDRRLAAAAGLALAAVPLLGFLAAAFAAGRR